MDSNYLTRRRISLSCLLLCTVTLFIISSYYEEIGFRETFYLIRPSHWSDTSSVKIVLWISPTNPPFKARIDRMKYVVDSMNENQTTTCSSLSDSYEPCKFSMSHESVHDADAILFFMHNNGYRLSELPSSSEQRRDQLWVMYAREPPPLGQWYHNLPNLFNWTMSYRRDSDIWTPYGRKILANFTGLPLFLGNYTVDQWIAGKSKLVAGVISNCHTDSRRETLIKILKNASIPVDIYGGCGNRKICGRAAKDCSRYWEETAKKYKFYLAIENSVCQDYITEKFWRTLELGMVPIVFGGGNYTLEAPPHSYIDVRDFKSADDLGKYFIKLDKNPKEYAKYFQWRKDYIIYANQTQDWCALCKAVQDFRKSNFQSKTYPNLKWWWYHQGNTKIRACRTNSKLEFFTK